MSKKATGRPPYGYRWECGVLVPHPAQQAALRYMRKLHDDGETNGQIAMRLTMDCIKPPAFPATKIWGETTVARLIRRIKAGEQ